jgi:hypothetical protein
MAIDMGSGQSHDRCQTFFVGLPKASAKEGKDHERAARPDVVAHFSVHNVVAFNI